MVGSGDPIGSIDILSRFGFADSGLGAESSLDDTNADETNTGDGSVMRVRRSFREDAKLPSFVALEGVEVTRKGRFRFDSVMIERSK